MTGNTIFNLLQKATQLMISAPKPSVRVILPHVIDFKTLCRDEITIPHEYETITPDLQQKIDDVCVLAEGLVGM